MDKIMEKEIVLGILHSEEFLNKFIDSSATHKDFDRKVFRWIIRKAISYYENPKYGRKRISQKVLNRYVAKDSNIEEGKANKYLRTIRSLYKKRPQNQEFALDEIERFSKTKKFVRQLEWAADSLEQNADIDSMVDQMAKQLMELELQRKDEWQQIDLLDDFEKRQMKRKAMRDNPDLSKPLTFGFEGIDTRIRRGVKAGEMVAFAAKTGIGKSIVLVHVGFRAMMTGLNVTHIVTENELDQIEGRYDARMTGVPYDIIQAYEYGGIKIAQLEQLERQIEMIRDLTKCRIKVIKCIPNKTNSMHIYNHLERLRIKEGHDTNVLLVDSPELMEPVAHFDQYRLRKAAVYWELKSLAIEQGLRVAVSSQLKASAEDKPTPEDMSEAYDKARLLDYMITMSRSEKQYLEDKLTFRIVKSRDSENDQADIVVNTDYSRMILDVGY